MLTPEEAHELLATARQIYIEEKQKEFKKNQLLQIYHIVYLALVTGLRRGELIGLKWDCINEETNTLTVKETIVEVKGSSRPDTPKTESAKRTIAIKSTVIETLREIRTPLLN